MRQMQFHQLGSQVKIPLQVGGIDDIDDRIRCIQRQIIARDDFLDCVWGERIDARQIDDLRLAVMQQCAGFLFDRNPGQLPTRWVEPVKWLNKVVFPLLGFPTSAMVFPISFPPRT